MVEDRITDGTRIAELLASELDGREDPPLDRLAVVNADDDVEPTVDGALAYEIALRGEDGTGGESDDDGSEEILGSVHVHPDRAHVEFATGVDAVEEAASDAGLRVRPKAVTPPRVLVFVESGAEVKRVVPAVAAAVEAEF
ncbi:hypothetical protein [Halomicrococcus gelatinilyticus]|uniref:hypothetical protein n=1 Tax=Halomicrococcus gelatinilyticus TaxID=1702103 RepID=UPI002E0D663E